MVKEKIENKKKYYICEEYGFAYIKREIAKKCQKWCKKYKSCNLEIIKNAVKI